MIEYPLYAVIGAFGADFAVLWETGRAIVTGGNPYAVWGAYYPPLTTLAFGLFGALPLGVSYALWLFINLAMLIHIARRRAHGWLLYFPLVFIFAAGNIDLFTLWLAQYLDRKDWRAVTAACLITLKPQCAFILLPWFLCRWLLHGDTKRFWTFVVSAFAAHGSIYLVLPDWYGQWLAKIASTAADRSATPPGVFALSALGVPLVPILALAFAFIVTAVLVNDEKIARACLLLALPNGMFYEASLLVEAAPWQLLTPLCLVLIALGYLTHTMAAWWAIPLPLAVIGYRVYLKHYHKEAHHV